MSALDTGLRRDRNDAVQAADKHGQIYAFAEVAFFRAAVQAGLTFKVEDFEAGQVARRHAWEAFLPFEEALDHLAGLGMAGHARKVEQGAHARIRRARLAYLELRGLDPDLARSIPPGVRPAAAKKGAD